MKKQLITLFACIAFAISGNAQVNPHAIGVRGHSGNFGLGGELSYQLGFGDANRLELDLGWNGRKGLGYNSSHIYLTGAYHWVWNISGGFNWFVGPGARVGFYSDKNDSSVDGITVGIGGQIGIEYDFNDLGAPLLLGLDGRPMFGVVGGNSGLGYGGALSLRYTF